MNQLYKTGSFVLSLSLTALLASCGGGGGGGAAPAPAPTTLGALTTVPAPENWSGTPWGTAQTAVVNITVNQTGGASVAGARVGLYHYSTTDPTASNPPAGTNLTTPAFATGEIESTLTNSSGQAVFSSHLGSDTSTVLVKVINPVSGRVTQQVASVSSLAALVINAD